MVHPSPVGHDHPVQFHIILLQQPQPDQFSCLLTVMDKFSDPWYPSNACVVLPNAVDHWALLHQAVVEFQCPPIDQQTDCKSWFGQVELTAGNLFPVHHAMCFTVVVEQIDSAPMLPTHIVEEEVGDIVELLQTRVEAVSTATKPLLPSLDDVLNCGPPLPPVNVIAAHCAELHVAVLRLVGHLVDDPPSIAEAPRPSLASSPVILSLEASLVPRGDPDQPPFRDEDSALVWLHDDNWAASCIPSRSIEFHQLPDGMHVPLEAFYALEMLMQFSQLLMLNGKFTSMVRLPRSRLRGASWLSRLWMVARTFMVSCQGRLCLTPLHRFGLERLPWTTLLPSLRPSWLPSWLRTLNSFLEKFYFDLTCG